jgi:hypothetical protein
MGAARAGRARGVQAGGAHLVKPEKKLQTFKFDEFNLHSRFLFVY